MTSQAELEQRACRAVDLRAIVVIQCRVWTGHSLCGTLFVARGPLRDVHGCVCGTYNVRCLDPKAGSHEACLDQEPI